MRSFISKPIVVFFIAMISVAAIFFLIPINLFDGEYTFKVNGVVFTETAKMSLSYFIGVGISPEDLKDVIDFRLNAAGYFLAFLFIFAFPALIAYRIYIANTQEKEDNLLDDFNQQKLK
jgi:hypothetical protein